MVQVYPASWNPAMVQRHAKLEALRARGINPYGETKYARTHSTASLLNLCAPLPSDAAMPQNVKIAGRLVLRRDMGKIVFANIEDESGRLQIFLKPNQVGAEAMEMVRDCLDLGDILGLEGDMFKTKTGEVTLAVRQITVLAKSLRPLPEKFHGLQDDDVKQRQRYLDLAASADVRETFRRRSLVVQHMRLFLYGQGFMEVETPILQDLHGGASARPFITHHNTLNRDLYLRIATELHLKRLLVGGYEAVFEIGRVFRNEGIDLRHNPEFTTMELYWAYHNYEDVMELTEQMLTHIAFQVAKSLQLNYQNGQIDLTPPWQRITVEQAIEKYGDVAVFGVGLEMLKVAAEGKGVHVEDDMTRGSLLINMFEALAEKQLVQPTFVYRYPVEATPLAKRCPDDPAYVDKTELYIAGMELANAYSELNDPVDQRARFMEQVEAAKAGDEEAQPFDEDFLQAVEVGMPPQTGIGIGIDRLAMVMTNSPSIRDVVLFPTMKEKGV
ncbi:MAG: lysine--tRNA ligase [Candidatus Margulisiibacteriota bacterium]